MNITGIICEYNPLHLGHKKQLDTVKQAFPQGGIVCLMSGNYVQRGKPAIIDKTARAKAAVLCGADLVLELPVTAALSSAEGFAARGVEILSGFCQNLCFGTENGTKESLMRTADALLSPAFSPALRQQLEQGLSFPAARQAALARLGVSDELLTSPNDILAVEYCKAILQQKSPMQPMPILRRGDYHDASPDPQNPSATALRILMEGGKTWSGFVPEAAAACFTNAPVHTLQAGERAVLARLRCMTETEFEALPYGTEGLWRKFMHAVREHSSIEAILTAVKSKRYTRTRLDRMLMCAFLGINRELLEAPVPYVRVLAFNDTGREILKIARQTGSFLNAGEKAEHPYAQLENRCADLYGLFAVDGAEDPGAEAARRVVYIP